MTPTFRCSRRFVLRAGAAGVATALLAGCQRKQVSFNSTDVTGADIGKDLSLNDFAGKPRSLQDFKGKALVVFFGYTQCPDVCPTTLAQLAQVRRALGDAGDRMQVAFVTVDPARDTAPVLKQYVTQFDPTFIGLYGDAAATARVAKSFKVYYAKVPGTEPGSYAMDHSAGMYIYDPQGNLRLFATNTATVEQLTHDIKQLIA
jgi:protein SCO1/2